VFERFTEKAIKVIMLAQEEARRLGHNFVGSEQLLLGLIGEGSGAAALAFKDCGVTLKAARTEVEKIIGRGKDRVSTEIPFTPNAKRILELSWDQARLVGDTSVGTEHLLMALIAAGPSVGMQVLDNLGADLSGIWEQMVYLRCETAQPLRDPLLMRVFGALLGIRKAPAILSESASKVIKGAQLGARAAGHWLVCSDQILLAILQNAESVAAKALLDSGITLEIAQAQLVQHSKEHPVLAEQD
jgi:ATP-dependent Clp protease ATP-binding subunit ClpA